MILTSLLLALMAGVLTLLLTPFIRDEFMTRGWVDEPDNVRKTHSIPVPRVGGIAIFLAYACSVATLSLMPKAMGGLLPNHGLFLPGIAFAVLVVFCTGLADDLFDLRPWQKVSGLLLAAVVAFGSGIKVQFLNFEWGPYVALPITVLWLIGCANAFNLIDGMDGLASGVGLVSTTTMLIAGVTQQNPPLIILTAPLCGALLGFLRYNFNPASVFLGDCGSLTLGFILGSFGALWSQKAVTLLGLAAPLFALTVPIVDVGLAITRRFLRNRPIFQGDAGHIHHRLLHRGMTVRRTVIILYGVCILAACASITLTTLEQRTYGSFVVVAFIVIVWYLIQQLKYTEFSVIRQLLFTKRLRNYVDTHTRFSQFEEQLLKANTIEELWRVICASLSDLHFLGARMQIDGIVYSEIPDDLKCIRHWQLRIPLPDDQHANFYRAFGESISPLLINNFVMTVESNIRRITSQCVASPKSDHCREADLTLPQSQN